MGLQEMSIIQCNLNRDMEKCLRFHDTKKGENNGVECYCKVLVLFAKFWCGVSPIRLETGHFGNIKLNKDGFNCSTLIGDETHVILHCSDFFFFTGFIKVHTNCRSLSVS